MTTRIELQPEIPLGRMLGVLPVKLWTIRLTPTEIATLQAARDITEKVRDAGKARYGDDAFDDVDDNWARAENGLYELIGNGEHDGVFEYDYCEE